MFDPLEPEYVWKDHRKKIPIIHTNWKQKSCSVVQSPVVTVMNLIADKNCYWITDQIHGPRQISRYKLFKYYERIEDANL